MNGLLILREQWPADLDPETVPFKLRTVTVLRRQGLYDDWSCFNDLTEADVLSWWNTGRATLADFRATASQAIKRHHNETDLRQALRADLETIVTETWASKVWHSDPRFAEYIPDCDQTVHGIAASGSALDRRYLWERLDPLRKAVERQADLVLIKAISQYVEAISGQRAMRLATLLARTSLDGQDPITATEASHRLGVSRARINQIERQLYQNRERARPAAGIWMPQVERAERSGWPHEITPSGVAAIKAFF